MKAMTRLTLALAALGVSGAAQAHEMFLRPASHLLAPQASTTITLVTGTFDKSANPVGRDRMRDVSIAAVGKISHPPHSWWRDDATASYLDLKVQGAGTQVIGVSTKPSVITLTAEDFDSYLRHDGIEDTLKARVAEPSAKSVRERYSKHVKTIIQVGDAPSADIGQVLGYPAEIVPQANPASLKVGDTMSFKAMLHGKPLAGQLIYASYEGHHGHSDDGGHTHAYRLRTDTAGEGAFKIARAGKWYVTLINMKKVDQPDVDYESNWATLTFQVR